MYRLRNKCFIYFFLSTWRTYSIVYLTLLYSSCINIVLVFRSLHELHSVCDLISFYLKSELYTNVTQGFPSKICSYNLHHCVLSILSFATDSLQSAYVALVILRLHRLRSRAASPASIAQRHQLPFLLLQIIPIGISNASTDFFQPGFLLTNCSNVAFPSLAFSLSLAP